MKNIILIKIALPCLFLTACQTMPYQPYAREVKRLPGKGGEIALKSEHRDEDRSKAQSLMTSNCGALSVNVLEEGEVVVGQTTNSNASETHNNGSSGVSMGSFMGLPISSGGTKASNDTATTATTTALKEWNIKYNCDKVAMAGTSQEAASPVKKVKK